MASQTTSRYGFIDTIRGIAACLVMLQHSLYQSGLLGDWPGTKLTGFIPNWLELGETGVVAFFLVSGFVIGSVANFSGGCARSSNTARFIQPAN